MIQAKREFVRIGCLTLVVACAVSRLRADESRRVHCVEMGKIKSAADFMAVPGVKIAWHIGANISSWLGNARDVDRDGRIDLVFVRETEGGGHVVRYDQDGKQVWKGALVNVGLGSESGLAIEDLDCDGTFEIVFNVHRQLWCIDADTGKTEWQIDLPDCRDNHQNAVVGHFLDRKRMAVVCRVYHDVTCYDAAGKKAWTYRIDNHNSYAHEMVCCDSDGNGLDEVYVSLNGKFVALGGDGKLRWCDSTCRNHSDFIFCGDVDGDGDREIVYDSNGCNAALCPILCADAGTGKPVQQWLYARPGKDHLQRAVLGDFDSSRPGAELAAVGKRAGMGGLIMWGRGGRPAWRRDIPARWVACADWDGDGTLEIMPSVGGGDSRSWEVWNGAGKRVFAVSGFGSVPLGIESAGREQPDRDGNGRAEVILTTEGDYVVLMEKP